MSVSSPQKEARQDMLKEGVFQRGQEGGSDNFQIRVYQCFVAKHLLKTCLKLEIIGQ